MPPVIWGARITGCALWNLPLPNAFGPVQWASACANATDNVSFLVEKPRAFPIMRSAYEKKPDTRNEFYISAALLLVAAFVVLLAIAIGVPTQCECFAMATALLTAVILLLC